MLTLSLFRCRLALLCSLLCTTLLGLTVQTWNLLTTITSGLRMFGIRFSCSFPFIHHAVSFQTTCLSWLIYAALEPGPSCSTSSGRDPHRSSVTQCSLPPNSTSHRCHTTSSHSLISGLQVTSLTSPAEPAGHWTRLGTISGRIHCIDAIQSLSKTLEEGENDIAQLDPNWWLCVSSPPIYSTLIFLDLVGLEMKMTLPNSNINVSLPPRSCLASRWILMISSKTLRHSVSQQICMSAGLRSTNYYLS